MDLFSKLHASQPSIVAPNHSRFYFLNRISVFPKYRHITLPFAGVGYESSFFYLTSPTPTLVFFACYNALYHLLSRIFIFSL